MADSHQQCGDGWAQLVGGKFHDCSLVTDGQFRAESDTKHFVFDRTPRLSLGECSTIASAAILAPANATFVSLLGLDHFTATCRVDLVMPHITRFLTGRNYD